MRVLSTLLTLISAGYVVGQTATSGGLGALPSGVPTCALSCATLFLSSTSECPNPASDPACLCKSSSFQTSAASCIVENCSTPSDQQAAYGYAQTLCSNAGVTLPSFSSLTAGASVASATATGGQASGTSATGAAQPTHGATSGATGQTIISNLSTFIFWTSLVFLWI